MNKTILIAGGASLASLAAGGAAGYFFARKQATAEFEQKLESEMEAMRKHYALREMDKKPSLEELAEQMALVDEPSDEEILLEQTAKTAQTNYQGYAGKASTDAIEQNNIFSSSAKPGKLLPPRDENSGRFRSTKAMAGIEEPADGAPYLITDEDFLENKTDYFQVYLLYFVGEDTLVKAHETGETLDNAVVGQDNLEKFPKVMEGEERRIFVRNDQVEEDYEILMMHEPLVDYIGLQES
jgi:hypothetical protein